MNSQVNMNAPISIGNVNALEGLDSINHSELFVKCLSSFKRFEILNEKEKRYLGIEFIDLLESNIEEASALYFDYIELFDSDPKLDESKKEFENVFEGDINQIKTNRLLPKKQEQFKSVIKSFNFLSKNDQKQYAKLFQDICEINPKEGYQLFDSFEEEIEGNEILRAVKDQNWNELKKHVKPFKIMSNYKLLNAIKGISIYEKGKDSLTIAEEAQVRNLLFVGETGSGKTTLINSITTYLLGIKQFDSVRVKSIVENSELSQSHSQTTCVTDYIIKPDPKRFPYPVRFIDTPGFGDTRGIKHDQENARKIWKYIQATKFNLHGICFVMKATTNRMTCIQQYIIHQILGLFGRDVEENFIGMITFADNEIPLAMQAIKDAQVPVKSTFKFNNSAFFPSTTIDDDSKMNLLYWEMGMHNFKQFFISLMRITPVSLVLTKEVIRARECLELKTRTIQEQINEGLRERKKLEREIDLFTKDFDEINNNKNFTYEEIYETSIQMKKPSGQFTTNCLNCHYMACHQDCSIKDDSEKSGCLSMNNDHCSICPGKCHWTVHRNLGYYYIKKPNKRTLTLENIKQKFFKGVKKVKSAEQILEKIRGKLRKLQEKY